MNSKPAARSPRSPCSCRSHVYPSCRGLIGWGFSGMLQRCACIAPAVVLVGLSTAHAVDTTLTLACQGTATDMTQPVDGNPEPTSKGIIINFTARTVAGLDFPLKITSSDETVVFRSRFASRTA